MKHVSKNRNQFGRSVVRLTVLSIITLMLVATARPTEARVPGPDDGGLPRASPLNPDFVAYREDPPDISYGYVPPTMDLSHVKSALPEGIEPLAFASSFDWRDQGKVTSVKNQNPCGTCWIFGTTAALESAALIAENVAYDFSEQSVALCVDRSWTYLYDDSTDPCMAGGNSYKASDVFIKKGAVQETCNPYIPSALNCDGSCTCDTCPPAKTVTGFRLVTDDGTQKSIIKNALTNHGPLIVSFHHDQAYEYSDPTWGTIYDYYPGPSSANHCVLIVGWNDAVPHPNPGHSGTGAWLIKNSWGTSHGDGGYAYLAYDSSHTTEIAYLYYRDHIPNEELLYWDETGFVGWRGWSDSTWMANVFTAPRDGNLSHVEFWTADNNVNYEIYVWSGAFGGQLAHKTGACQELGYYSIPLDSPLSFTSGQKFTIGVRLTGYVPVERAIAGSAAPPIQSNVSYLRHTSEDSWIDLANVDGGENACLRARMSNAASNRPPTLSNLPNQTVPMNGSRNRAIDLWAYAEDAEDTDAELTFRISNAPIAAAGVTLGSDRYIDINPASGWTGTTNVEVEVQDTGGLADTDTFQVTVKVITYRHFVYLPVVLRKHTVGPSPQPSITPSPKPTSSPTPTPTGEPPLGLLNGDFEDGPTGWTEFSAHGWDLIVTEFVGTVTARSGNWAAWLGGDFDDMSFIQQQVTVPPGSPYLVYWHWIASEDVCGFDFAGVTVDGTVIDQYDLCDSESTEGWVRHAVNLGAYSGQSILLQIKVETDESFNSNLFVDDVSFQASATTVRGGSYVADPRNSGSRLDAGGRQAPTRGEDTLLERLFR